MSDRLPRNIDHALTLAYAERAFASPEDHFEIDQRIYLLKSAQQGRAEAAMTEELR